MQVPLRNMTKESAQYAKRMRSKAALQKIKYGIEKLMLQEMFDTMGVARMGRILQIMQKHERATSQWPSESALEEDEAPIPARRARVSRVLLSWFIFEPAPREMNVSEAP